MAQPAPGADHAARVDAFAERVLGATAGAFELLSGYLGHALGYYRALADAGQAGLASPELAERTATAERYAREWLEQQASCGIASVLGELAAPEERRFYLPPAHAEVLADPDSLSYLAPLMPMIGGIAGALPRLLEAYRSGAGVPYAAYGADFRHGQGAINRTTFLTQLGREWIPVMPDVDAALRRMDPPARVADFGCGLGWSSIGLALAYPNARVDGYDLDGPSVAEAREHARAHGVTERVRFFERDVADPALAGRYDLVVACETLHDLGEPVAALTAARRLLAEGGAALVVDERVGERFTATCDATERLMYGWSVLHCLAVGLADGHAGTGTCMRPATLRRYALDAGFRAVEVLPVENLFFRLYRLLP